MQNYNCSFKIIDSLKSFVDCFILLLLGSGFGYRVLPEDVEKLPTFRHDIEITHKQYDPISKSEKDKRKEYTELSFSDNDSVATITVGDSKEGWSESLEHYLNLITKHNYEGDLERIIFDYDNVRPKGERLETFGGRASGPQSLMRMFNKIDQTIKRRANKENDWQGNRVKLKPIDASDICNAIAENVVFGGVRRSSQIALFDKDDKEMREAKSNLYMQKDGEWKLNKDLSHRQMSNNSVMYFEKPSMEELDKHIEEIRHSGEPGFINAAEAQRRFAHFKGVNPCLTGDMELLTVDGYKKIKNLAKKDNVKLINKDGNVSEGKVWQTGVKDTVKLVRPQQKDIVCTPDHEFMTIEKEAVKAKDLKGKKLMPYLKENNNLNKEYIKLGFVQGNGVLERIDSKDHKGIEGIEVNIGEEDKDILEIFEEKEMNNDGRTLYTRELNEKLEELGFDLSSLPNRILPNTFKNWTAKEKASFLRGLFSANGSVIGNSGRGRVTLKTTCKKLVEQVKETLLSVFNIDSYITTNESQEVKFANEEYECKESYDLNINKYESRLKFYNQIGFVHDYKMNKLKKYLLETSPTIQFVTNHKEKTVYDFNEPKTHWGVVEGFITHNCAEILLDSSGVCNLTSLNTMAFYDEEKDVIDMDKMLKAQKLSARAGVRMTTLEFELHDWNRINKKHRLIGCSLTGWQDLVNAAGLSKEKQKNILQKLRDVAHNAAEEYAKELGIKTPKLVTTVKPEGTYTQMPTVSSGLHFNHSPYYIRRVRINADDPLAYACEELGFNVKPEVGHDPDDPDTVVIEFPISAPDGKTKHDVSAIEQLEVYKMMMENYVDHNASITVHVRDDEWQDVKEWIYENWNSVVGITFISYDNSFYDLMPYEEISEERYKEMLEETPVLDTNVINKYEKMTNIYKKQLEESSCESGMCPVR